MVPVSDHWIQRYFRTSVVFTNKQFLISGIPLNITFVISMTSFAVPVSGDCDN